MNATLLRVLVVDDETPARSRLRDLLGDIAGECPNLLVGMAANGLEALRLIEQGGPVDAVLCDIRMPVMDGVELTRHLARLPAPPAVIFTTAYDQYAVQAFELAAVDYLLKPVRAERLAAALAKVRQRRPLAEEVLAALAPGERRHFSVNERGRILLLPVAEVRYLKAELKYVTARTAEREFVLDEALTQIELEFAGRFLRIHRNCLVARAAVVGVERAGEQDGEAHWEILLAGIAERLPVSRRQWPTVKQALGL